MSKIKALITTLVLGTSSVAMASPAFTFHADAQWHIGNRTEVVRDHRSHYAAPMTWLALSQPMAAGRNTIRISNAATLSSLKLQSTGGASYVESIRISFANGRSQFVSVNRWLDTRNPVQITLTNNRALTAVTVNGSATRRASYQLMGLGYAEMEAQPPVYQPPAYQPPVYQPPVYRGVLLGSGLDFAHSDGREFIKVGAEKGAFSQLHIVGNSGSTYVKMVLIQFADGQQQFISAVNRELRAGESVDLQLDGGRRAITQVTVWMKEDGAQVDYATGEFSLFAL